MKTVLIACALVLGAGPAEAAAIFNRTADLLGNADHLSPNPVCPAG